MLVSKHNFEHFLLVINFKAQKRNTKTNTNPNPPVTAYNLLVSKK